MTWFNKQKEIELFGGPLDGKMVPFSGHTDTIHIPIVGEAADMNPDTTIEQYIKAVFTPKLAVYKWDPYKKGFWYEPANK